MCVRVYVCECVESLCVYKCVRNILCVCVILQLGAASEAGDIFYDENDLDRAIFIEQGG